MYVKVLYMLFFNFKFYVFQFHFIQQILLNVSHLVFTKMIILNEWTTKFSETEIWVVICTISTVSMSFMAPIKRSSNNEPTEL